jgi:hypothetical protein
MRKTIFVGLLLVSGLISNGCAGASAKAQLPHIPVDRVYISGEGSQDYPYDTKEFGGDLYCVCSVESKLCNCFDPYTWFNRIDPGYSCRSVIVPQLH